MENIVNTSLDIIRRHKARHPRLHSRWGDVAITPPVEGAWSQFDNPYIRDEREYGPGFIPSLDISNKEVLLLESSTDGSDDELAKEKNIKEGRTGKEADSKAISKAKRLTRILLPSSVNSTVRKSADKGKANDFQYRPVQPDYAQEVVEKIDQQSRPHFRYVPASRHYLYNLKRHDIRLSDSENTYGHYDTDDDADDENEIKEKSRSGRQERQRSHSCDPDVGGRSFVVTTGRRKPRPFRGTPLETINSPTSTISLSDTMSSSTLSRSSGPRANSTSRLGEQEHSPRWHAMRRLDTKPQVITVQRSKSDVKKVKRRTMTLEMVRDQEDLWY
ncbi:conserved hypothetical protein [Talaromyces stipitatus ATCC 10500]|uniref:Uncharacterized protein n=1 Tax=Talaromyces stipitatus (strain ATCC 10500 / CBS 375.48 / QM 6759 / NRRL 1006) TaxID=441959 RepID=B8MHT8_TALSN|nr:uncharacterized protein TSTA_015070 [Talaromyces stipitatus ATCC 10500]EED16418.1 conserved hypothetical protein [Talaromyces stipitatus ATCC 10500]